MRRRHPIVTALLCLVLLLAGCTGVPDSSAPVTVAPVEAGGSGSTPAQPPRNVSPREIVSYFLEANATPPSERAYTRSFLTSSARSTWNDQTATVIDDENISGYTPRDLTTARKVSVVVTGRILGRIDSTGVYTSVQSGPTADFPFTLTRDSSGQFRIDQLKPGLGLLLREDQFMQNYQQQILYFYDLNQHYLVPDLRWSAVTDSAALARSLVVALEAGPRPDLQNVVTAQTFPTQAGVGRTTVRVRGATMIVNIPGSSQLLPAVRNRLAAQLAYTLQYVLNGDDLEIADGAKTVQIPEAGGSTFTMETFPNAGGPAQPADELYYVRYGKVTTMQGKNVSGPLGDGASDVNTIALARRGTPSTLMIAATEGTGSAQRLYIGTVSGGLKQTPLTGPLTRPCWAPGLSEVWVGSGSSLHRIALSGTKVVSDTTVTIPSIQGVISAVRISPDGSQVALVVSAATGASAQVYVGGIGRDASAVSVGALTQVSPNGLVALDVGWSNAQKLFVIGYQQSNSNGGAYETGVDGSFWSSYGISKLPTGPVRVAASTNGSWVEADGEVWEQDGGSWASPSPTGSAPGTAPVYLG